MSVVIIIPVLERPWRVEPLIESIESGTPEPHRTVFVATPDDTSEMEAITAAGGTFICTEGRHRRGDYAKKINLAYLNTDEPYLFLGADDLDFHPGWLPAALAKLEPGVGVVGTNDLGSPRVINGTHATHSLVTRAYVDQYGTVDEQGKVLHEGYWHEFVDDEFVQTAKRRNAFAFAFESHVEHLHPSWGKAPLDHLYERQRDRMEVGRRLFHKRSHLWSS